MVYVFDVFRYMFFYLIVMASMEAVVPHILPFTKDRRRLFTLLYSSDASIKLPHIRLRDVARFCHANSARFDQLQCLV